MIIDKEDTAMPPLSQQQPFKFIPKSGITIQPTIDEYKKFHKMNCDRKTSQNCIDSFDGCVLFGSLSQYQDITLSLESYDLNRVLWPRLTLLNYYGLCLFTLTGIISLLGWTKLLICHDEEEESSNKGFFATTKNHPQEQPVLRSVSFDQKLYIPSKVIDYMLEKSIELSKIDDLEDNNDNTTTFTTTTTTVDAKQKPRLMLQKRFEYKFGNNYVDVVMFHFVCNNGYKYLVEVYQTSNLFGSIIEKFINTIQKLISKLGDRTASNIKNNNNNKKTKTDLTDKTNMKEKRVSSSKKLKR